MQLLLQDLRYARRVLLKSPGLSDGSGLEQVTNFGGFTAFPEFSPDGKKLVFASDKDARQRYEFNIFTADWVR